MQELFIAFLTVISMSCVVSAVNADTPNVSRRSVIMTTLLFASATVNFGLAIYLAEKLSHAGCQQ